MVILYIVKWYKLWYTRTVDWRDYNGTHRGPKTRKQKYEAKAYTTIGCRMRREEAEAFSAACKARGTTVNAVLKATVDKFMSESAEFDKK